MKTACRETIPIYYPSAISPNCDGGNQLEYYGVVKREVHNLLTHRTKPFHIDGKDENVCIPIQFIVSHSFRTNIVG